MQVVDFVVVGSGIAGLNTALALAPYGQVLVITKKKLRDSSTNFAQGGIAAVSGEPDSFTAHVQDTLVAGGFHNNVPAVEFLAKHGFAAIQQLMTYGVPFDKEGAEYALGLEAAHSFPRIFHATDFTGREVAEVLIRQVQKNRKIHINENTCVLDLIVKNGECFGLQVLRGNTVEDIFARVVILATGGVGQLFKWTTNPSVATGDGIAIAQRAGAKLSNMEYIQFHPTLLNQTGQPFLLSESLRGEGAWLLNEKGERFMQKIDPRGELAPRDIVARAIFTEQKRGNVYLDIRHRSKSFLQKRFPNISAELRKRGLDLVQDLLPVTAAAHFLCGGITTDLYGKTSLKNLYAYGEVADSGVHGANRLASNSLLEGMVFSSRIKECVNEFPAQPKIIKVVTKDFPVKSVKDEARKKSRMKNQLRSLMWEKVGIIRSKKNLFDALAQLCFMEKKAVSLDLKNMIQVARHITEAALLNPKSLGAHYREDAV